MPYYSLGCSVPQYDGFTCPSHRLLQNTVAHFDQHLSVCFLVPNLFVFTLICLPFRTIRLDSDSAYYSNMLVLCCLGWLFEVTIKMCS